MNKEIIDQLLDNFVAAIDCIVVAELTGEYMEPEDGVDPVSAARRDAFEYVEYLLPVRDIMDEQQEKRLESLILRYLRTM